MEVDIDVDTDTDLDFIIIRNWSTFMKTDRFQDLQLMNWRFRRGDDVCPG